MNFAGLTTTIYNNIARITSITKTADPEKVVKKIIYLIVFGIFLFFCFRWFEKRHIYYPTRKIEFTPEDINLSFEDIYFDTSDGVRLNGWFIPVDKPRATLIFCHGNGGNISHRLEKIAMFNRLGLDVFIIDYRGYGKSTGRPSEAGIYLDAKAAYDYLVKEKGLLAKNLIVFGESLGCAAAVDLATKNETAGLILEAPFTSARDMARIIYPFLPTIFLSVRFDSLAKIGNVSVPKLIIHSRNDEIVPFKLGRKLFDASSQPKEFLEILGGHNSAFFDSQDLFVAAIRRFLEEL